MTRRFRFVLTVGASLFPLFATAHTGPFANHVSGLAIGLAHPFSGADHMLAMLAVGMWAGQLGGRSTWQVPASFVALMVAGAILAIFGTPVPAPESGILVSLIVFGLLLALALRVPAALGSAAVGLFALFHGAAHGLEMPLAGHPFTYAAGFVLATVILHVAGICFSKLCNQRTVLAPRIAGAAITGMGVILGLENSGLW